MAGLTGMAGPLGGCSRWLRDQWIHHAGDLAYRLRGFDHLEDMPLPTEAPRRPARGQVAVVRTAYASAERLEALPPLQFRRLAAGGSQGSAAAGVDVTVTVDPRKRFQTFLGFGGSFTEASATLPMSEEQRLELATAYYSKDRGLGYRFGRIHMNSCDFSDGNWSCCDRAGDMALASFSIARYHEAIIPLLRLAATAAGERLQLLASPWSPPGWMKDSGEMCHGGKLLDTCREVWARFYVRFAQEFRDVGLTLWGFTVQNEPKASMRWESCIYNAEEERDFVRDHLGPALQSSGLGLNLIVHDHNRNDILEAANTFFSDSAASRHIWGIGFHWYGDPEYEFWPPWSHDDFLEDCENLQRVHDAWPTKHIVFTEGCQEKGARIGDWALGERYAMEIIRQLNMWTEAWIDWNLVLDETGGPNHVGNYCSAPVIFDTRRGELIYQSSYYYIGHFSRHIQAGAQRIGCRSDDDDLEVTAFTNPDGMIVVVVLNRTRADLLFSLQHAGQEALGEAPARSITTLSFEP